MPCFSLPLPSRSPSLPSNLHLHHAPYSSPCSILQVLPAPRPWSTSAASLVKGTCGRAK